MLQKAPLAPHSICKIASLLIFLGSFSRGPNPLSKIKVSPPGTPPPPWPHAAPSPWPTSWPTRFLLGVKFGVFLDNGGQPDLERVQDVGGWLGVVSGVRAGPGGESGSWGSRWPLGDPLGWWVGGSLAETALNCSVSVLRADGETEAQAGGRGGEEGSQAPPSLGLLGPGLGRNWAWSSNAPPLGPPKIGLRGHRRGLRAGRHCVASARSLALSGLWSPREELLVSGPEWRETRQREKSPENTLDLFVTPPSVARGSSGSCRLLCCEVRGNLSPGRSRSSSGLRAVHGARKVLEMGAVGGWRPQCGPALGRALLGSRGLARETETQVSLAR